MLDVDMDWANAKCRYSAWSGTLPEWTEHIIHPDKEDVARLLQEAEWEHQMTIAALNRMDHSSRSSGTS